VVITVAGIQTKTLSPGYLKEPGLDFSRYYPWPGWENTQLSKWKSLFRYTTGTLTDETLLAVIVVWHGQDGSQLSY